MLLSTSAKIGVFSPCILCTYVWSGLVCEPSNLLIPSLIIQCRFCSVLSVSDCGLYVVGSSMNGFGSLHSDMDLCLMLSHCEVCISKFFSS